jgi:hypothetical protein
MPRLSEKKLAQIPLFDSEYVVTPVPNCRTVRGTGNINALSPALGNCGPVRTADPTCLYCGRTGTGVETKPFGHAVPRSIWRGTDRVPHGSKFANPDSLIFFSDWADDEGRARIVKLGVPLYRCTEEVRESRVKVHGKKEGTIEELIVDHEDMGFYCPCDELDRDGECMYEADEDGEHDGCGGRKIDFERVPYVVFDDVDENCTDRYMHWACAIRTCDGCNKLCPQNIPEDSEEERDDWLFFDTYRTDLGKTAVFCVDCSPSYSECHGCIDYQNADDAEDPFGECSGKHKFSRLPLLPGHTRLGSFYCENHMPSQADKPERKHPTSKPPAKRPAKISGAESDSDN